MCSDEISRTKRNRAYWINNDVPEDWCDGLRSMDPDTYMDPGCTVQTYPGYGKDCVRPLGASWSDDPVGPVTNTCKPLLVNDQTNDEAHHVRPHVQHGQGALRRSLQKSTQLQSSSGPARSSFGVPRHGPRGMLRMSSSSSVIRVTSCQHACHSRHAQLQGRYLWLG